MEPIEVEVRGVKARIYGAASNPGCAWIADSGLRALNKQGEWTPATVLLSGETMWPSPADARAFVGRLNAEWEREKAIPGPCSYCGSPDHWRPDCPQIPKDHPPASQPPQGEPQPRERLTGDDPPGEYSATVLVLGKWERRCLLFWDGIDVRWCHDSLIVDPRCKPYDFRGPLTYSPDLTRQLAAARRDRDIALKWVRVAEELAKAIGAPLNEADPDTFLAGCLKAITALKAQNAEYKRWFDGEGVESRATTCAELRGQLASRDAEKELTAERERAENSFNAEIARLLSGSEMLAALSATQAEQLKAKDAEIERLRGCEINLGALRPKLADCEDALRKANAENERLKVKADSFDALWQVCIECGMEVHPPGIDEDGELVPEEYAFQFGFIRGLKEKLTAAQAAHGTASQLVSYASSELHRLLGYEPSAASLSTLFTKLEERLTAAQAALKAAEERAEFLDRAWQQCNEARESAERELATVRQQLAELQNKAAP